MSVTIRKPFQEATIDHVVRSLRASGASRRFLVADEVGLGKTLVAQGVIQDLMERPRRRGGAPCVLYVCSNLTIAKQNHDALVDFLEPGQRNDHPADRLSLLPRDDLEPSKKLRLYSLTPYTSTGSGGGRAEERAVLANALELLRRRSGIDGRYSRHVIERLSLTVDPGRFEWLREHKNNQLGDARVLDPFRVQLCKELGCKKHAHTTTILKRLRARFNEHPTSGVEVLRRAMALAVLEVISPDLVILDEFQRFAELLPEDADDDNGEDAADTHEVNTVMRAILRSDGPRRQRPYVLMLSATPYRLFTRASDGHQHHEGFFSLMRFLLDDQEEIAGLREAFATYRDRLATTALGDKKLLALRDKIEALLLVAMCRTERPSGMNATPHAPVAPELSLTADDVRVFRQLAETATDMPVCAEPYWSSIPYPLQAMDSQYVLRQHVDENGAAAGQVEAPQLSRESVRGYEAISYPHPRLRGLLDVVPASLRQLPWLPPTLPWWDLSLPFSLANDTSKALVFSHFRATPRILAAIVSYEAERDAYAHGKIRYDYWLRTRSEVRGAGAEDLGAGASTDLRHQPRSAFSMVRGKGRLGANLCTLVHFAPVLSSLIDPLEVASTTRERGERLTFEGARQIAGERVLEILGASTRPKPGRSLDWGRMARWVVTLEARSDEDTLRRLRAALGTWADENVEKHPGAAEGCRYFADNIEPFPSAAVPTTVEVDVLAELALASPGAALFRAWERVFRRAHGAHLQRRMIKLTTVGLIELASYLDTPEWQVSLRPSDFGARSGHRSFADVVRSAVWGGNLESVLDELLATFVRYAPPSRRAHEDVAIERLSRALTLRDASVAIRRTVKSGPGRSVRMRCHAAAPLGLSSREVMDDNDALRTDNLRVAFNSPFRPMMLVTTSIGQEGLDFHQYARRVVHWDLPSDPVELEQRDGRLMRFGSLAVRRSLARASVRGEEAIRGRGSPWLAIGARARNAESLDGMSPWWVTEDAAIERVLLVPPFSRQRADFDDLEDLVALYRLALGQPDQEHLIRAVRTRISDADDADRGKLLAWYREASLRLSPWRRLSARDLGKLLAWYREAGVPLSSWRRRPSRSR